MGPHLGNNLVNLGIEQAARAAMAELGQDLDDMLACEEEPGLGNGGLGRLAACYLDSLATLERPAIGYGIRYEFGIFDQEIRDGWQAEMTDKWLRYGNPWEIAKPEIVYYVNWGGHTEHYRDDKGCHRVRWVPHRVVKGTAYDTPIQGYGVNTCNTLRLWSAEAVESFDFQAFNAGDYYQAVEEKMVRRQSPRCFIPTTNRRSANACGWPAVFLRVVLAAGHAADSRHRGRAGRRFAERFAVQLNDTHPSIGVAELMRLLVDERNLDWDMAWDIILNTFGYTNHTLLPEALETWPLSMFGELLPRHLEIIYEINARFLDEVRARFPGDEARVAAHVADRRGGRQARAHGSSRHRRQSCRERRGRTAYRTAEGKRVAGLLRALAGALQQQDQRRHPAAVSGARQPGPARADQPLHRQRLDHGPDELKKLEAFADDAAFRADWRAVKQANKERLAAYIHAHTGIELDPAWLFDIQVKRIHEYKRQHLNVLHIVTLYKRLKDNPALEIPPRAFIFGGKAAPGYFMAKRIIKLINAVAETVNSDPDVNRRMKVAFVPNFNVQNAHLIYPAADLSEQISTAGKEASGTGNMKFMLNGALTIGTLDGANVEIREEVGAENFFLFGLTAAEVEAIKRADYRPGDYVEANAELRAVLDLIASGRFSRGDCEVFRSMVDNLRHADPFLVLADYAAYIACQEQVNAAWKDGEGWTRMSILNSARSGKFSSDRAIGEYCDDIWNVQPVSIALTEVIRRPTSPLKAHQHDCRSPGFYTLLIILTPPFWKC